MQDILIGKNLKANGVIYHKNIHFNQVTNLLNNFNNISASISVGYFSFIYLTFTTKCRKCWCKYTLTSDETVVSLRFILLSLDPREFRPQNLSNLQGCRPPKNHNHKIPLNYLIPKMIRNVIENSIWLYSHEGISLEMIQ